MHETKDYLNPVVPTSPCWEKFSDDICFLNKGIMEIPVREEKATNEVCNVDSCCTSQTLVMMARGQVAMRSFILLGQKIHRKSGRKDQTRMDANKELLFQHVKFLTTLRPFRNYLNPESLEQVCHYLIGEFEKYGLKTTEQTFIAQGSEYKNIIASYNPQKQRRLIVGAHYDVCGDQPGADDNASAVAGLLESARMVAEAKPDIDYRIDFVSFCLEEPPFYATQEMGSYIHAKSINPFKADVIGLINFEMIGYFHDGDQQYPDARLRQIYPQKANFIVIAGKNTYHKFNQKVYELMKEAACIDVQIIDHPMVEGLASMSDQRSYWEFDIPALMINDTSYLRNPNYHLMSDDIDTLSFDQMKEVVMCTYKAITGFN
jgi:hypothetical protein